MTIAKHPIQKRVGYLHPEIPIKSEGSSKRWDKLAIECVAYGWASKEKRGLSDSDAVGVSHAVQTHVPDS